MSYIDVAERAPDPADPSFHEDLTAEGVVQRLVGTSDQVKVGDLIGSYKVIRITGGNHNDTPAKTLTLALEGTEVGRLILVPTEGQEGFLEFVRVFTGQAEYDRFRAQIERGLPPGVRRIPARALVKGDVIVDASGRETGTVDSVELVIDNNQAGVLVSTYDRHGRVFAPQRFSPEDELNVRAP